MRVKICYHEDTGERNIFDLYPRVQATDFDTQKGVRIIKGGAYIGFVDKNDYIGYNHINFGPSGSTKSILLRYAKGNTSSAKIQIRTGSATGTVIGEIPVVQNTGGWETFTTLKITLNQDVEGLNDLYIVCANANGAFDFEWFELSQQV